MPSDLAQFINQPLQIGSRTIAGRLVLAPMTGLGHVAFRQWLDDLGGCGLMYSEMCSAARIPHENRYRSSYFRWRDAEADRLAIQILGSEPEKMAAAAERIEADGLFGVDVNLGCSVREVCRYDQGAALLKEPDRAVQLVARVRRAVKCPVTVKFRTGWEDDPARRFLWPGVWKTSAWMPWFFIPGWRRIGAPDRPNGPILVWSNKLSPFPFSATATCSRLRIVGRWCGRPDAMAWPWGASPLPGPGFFLSGLRAAILDQRIYLQGALQLLELVQAHFEPVPALRRFRQYASYLASNFAFGNTLFNQIRRAADPQAIKDVLISFFSSESRGARTTQHEFHALTVEGP